MSEWKKVKIGDFLKEREGRYKPNDSSILKYQRLDKIDFSGKIHLSSKSTKTDMILVYPGDLVISGINVAKGAITVYKGEEIITATIHYSSYVFDDSVVDLDFFKYFVKSPIFVETIKRQVKGGIKTEIKSKVFRSLEISIPDVTEQKAIAARISKALDKISELSLQIEIQKKDVQKLRQNILQDAIEGKLTEDWRKKHPVVKGDPDYDAAALFEKIQEEKQKLIAEGKIKKEKSIQSISEDEKSFEIPESWKWMKIVDFCEGFQYGTASKSIADGKCPVLRMGNIQNGSVDWEKLVFTNDAKEIDKYAVKKGDLLFNRTNSREWVGKTALFNDARQAIYAGYLVKFTPIIVDSSYLNVVMNSKMHREWCNSVKTDALGQSNINAEKLKNFVVPIPSLEEQKDIVSRVEKHLSKIDQLGRQIESRESQVKDLLQSILYTIFDN